MIKGTDTKASIHKNPGNKKLKKIGFEKLLNSLADIRFEDRAEHIDSFLKNWQGENYQVDDQSILCIKFSNE